MTEREQGTCQVQVAVLSYTPENKITQNRGKMQRPLPVSIPMLPAHTERARQRPGSFPRRFFESFPARKRRDKTFVFHKWSFYIEHSP